MDCCSTGASPIDSPLSINRQWRSNMEKCRPALAAIETLESRRLLSGYTLNTLAGFPLEAAPFESDAEGGVAVDGSGNVYGLVGVATFAGAPSTNGGIFEFANGSSAPTLLASFNGTNGTLAGAAPDNAVILDGGILYGTTDAGGANGDGVVFELPAGSSTITALASFNSGDGAASSLTAVGDNLYGTTEFGGVDGEGSIFEIPLGGGTISTIVSFNDTDGSMPTGGLAVDSAGNLYGTTEYGGADYNGVAIGSGTVFELPNGASTVTTLASFGSSDGTPPALANPRYSLALDADGNLYGTANDQSSSDIAIFELADNGGTITQIADLDSSQYVFVNPIVCDSAGDVFGTSQQGGGDGYGSVFEVPAGSSTVMPLVAFNPATNGAYPEGALTLNNGNLYGTTSSGTAANDTEGTVFELSTSSTTAGVSATLTFTQQPVSAAVGAIIAPAVTVAIDDASGNLVTADNSDVTLAVASGPAGATLGGTVTVAAQNGVAVFSDLSLSLPGIYTLEATDGTLTAVTSMTFAVSSTSTSGSPAQLAFAQQPSDAIAGATLSPPVVVDVEDSTGALVATDASNVTVAIAGGPAGAMLGGTTTVAAQNGAATFNNLTLSEAGAYTLVATDGALSSATSISFNVAATVSSSPPSQLAPALGKVILPPAIVSGSKLKARISVGITNTGSAFKGGFSVNIYADARTTLDGSQVLVASAAKKVSLKTGKGTTVNFSVNSLPATLADGTYHLLAEVIDPFSQTNVTATTQTVQIAAAFVQPAVTVGAVIPATIALRKSGSVVVTIANAGNVAASGIEIALSPSSDGVTPLAGVILDAVRSGAKIDPGKKKTFRLHFRVPSGAASGSYSPYVSVTLGGVTTSMVGRTQFTVG